MQKFISLESAKKFGFFPYEFHADILLFTVIGEKESKGGLKAKVLAFAEPYTTDLEYFQAVK